MRDGTKRPDIIVRPFGFVIMSKVMYGNNPIFEIVLLDHRISIYANGVVEGAEFLGQGRIINRCSRAVRPELLDYFSKSHEVVPSKSPYAILSPSGSGLSQSSGKNDANIPAQADAATGEK